ncbi:lipopolysaccharide biosynthesis protein [Thermosporothrix hazakensis]|jgi:O-antigen/teichoic acid export membrane protein|nr:oligosaccharide flippase family protein [Thermosporothrix hazakensis]
MTKKHLASFCLCYHFPVKVEQTVGGVVWVEEHMLLPLARKRVEASKPFRLYFASWPVLLSFGSTLISGYISFRIIQYLGFEDFGTYIVLQWLATLILPLVSIGSSALTSRALAELQSRETPRIAAGIFYLLWSRQSRAALRFIMLIVLGVYPLALLLHLPWHLLFLANLATLPMLFNSIAGIALSSQRRRDLLTLLQLFNALLTLFLLLWIEQLQEQKLLFLFLINVIAGALTLAVAIYCVTQLLPLDHPMRPGIFLRERLLKHCYSSLKEFVPDSIIWQNGEYFFLLFWQPHSAIGIYALSVSLSTWIMRAVPHLFSLVLYPFLTRSLRRAARPQDMFLRHSCYLALVAIPLFFLAALLVPIIVEFLFGPQVYPFVLPFYIQLLASAVGCVATVSYTYLASLPQRNYLLRLNWCAALLKLVLAGLLIQVSGTLGAALACSCAQIFAAGGAIWLCHHALKCSNVNELPPGLHV